ALDPDHLQSCWVVIDPPLRFEAEAPGLGVVGSGQVVGGRVESCDRAVKQHIEPRGNARIGIRHSQQSDGWRYAQLEVVPVPAAVIAAVERSEDAAGWILRRSGNHWN